MTPNTNSRLLDWAQFYVHIKGYSVIPLVPKDKFPDATVLPMGQDGKPTWKPFETEKPTDDNLVRWFSGGGRNRNIAIIGGQVSGLTFIDCDTTEAVERMNQEQPDKTGKVRTGKGLHLYCRFVPELRNMTKFLPGTDLKTEGGYVVAPPSIHPTGKRYEWIGRRLP